MLRCNVIVSGDWLRIAEIGETAKRLFPERAKAVMEMEGATGHHYLACFNDHPETTFEDVRRVLLEAGL
jgi:hypothetical protein